MLIATKFNDMLAQQKQQAKEFVGRQHLNVKQPCIKNGSNSKHSPCIKIAVVDFFTDTKVRHLFCWVSY